MHYVWVAIIGLIVGALAKLIMPGKDPGGIIVTILLGVVGAFIGGYLGTLLGLGSVDGFDVRSFFIAVVGAVLLLAVYRMVTGRKVA